MIDLAKVMLNKPQSGMTQDQAYRLAQKSDFLMGCQERTGIAFDHKKANVLYVHCVEEMTLIETNVEPKLPLKPMNKSELKKVTPPKIQFKNSKEGLVPSAAAEKFFDSLHNEPDGYYGCTNGKKYKLPHHEPVETMTTMRLGNQKDIKNWLMVDHKWRPQLWNYKKGQDGKFIREKGKLVKTSPKFHDKGVLCTNLESLGDTIELVKPVVRWLSLRNRRSVIYNPSKGTGWLCNSRLKVDGRLPAGASNITNTHRQKHKVVVNVPRVGSILGAEMRELFTVAKGNVMVGWDASGLEGRVEAHHCFSHEGGEAYAFEIIDGDIHSKTAKIFFGDDISEEDGKVIGKYRNVAKSGRYCLSYGGGAPKLADTLNVPQGKAKELYDAFWDGNTALNGLKESLVKHWKVGGSKGIKCSLTGHTILSRSEHSLVNLLLQHTGAIIMDLSGCLMDTWLGGIKYDSHSLPYYLLDGHEVRRVIYMHDEYQWECKPEIADKLGAMGVKSIEEAGKFLKLNVPLTAEYGVGASWKDTH